MVDLGTISSLGPDCSLNFGYGDNVMALLPGGGYAEFCVADERTVMKVPSGISMTEAASIPEAFATAYQLLFVVAKAEPGDSVLIHAGSSSVGQAAIQLARASNIIAFATTRSPEKSEVCRRVGAAATFEVADKRFANAVKTANGGKPVDIVLDPVGSDYVNENLEVLGMDGRWVLYGLLSGPSLPSDCNLLSKLLSKRISLLSSTIRNRSVEYKENIFRCLSVKDGPVDAIAKKEMTVIVDHTFPLEKVLDAHSRMRENKNSGKIVMLVSNSASAIDSFQKELKEMQNRLLK